jgi:hypothetical protein
MSNYVPEIFNYDANEPAQLQQAMRVVFDPEGSLSTQAQGDEEYLRILQTCVIAEVVSSADRSNPEKARKMKHWINLLNAYEERNLGGTGQAPQNEES